MIGAANTEPSKVNASHTGPDAGLEILREVRPEVGQVALLGEAGHVTGLVVMVRGVLALELGDQLVVDAVPGRLRQHDVGVRPPRSRR